MECFFENDKDKSFSNKQRRLLNRGVDSISRRHAQKATVQYQKCSPLHV